MKARTNSTDPKEEAEKLLSLAQNAPPAQRSALKPYLAVLLTLRQKGYSYEKIADFLNENTEHEFTRSQVFSFVKRNWSVLGLVDQKQEDADSEPLPNQLILDHSKALLEALPQDIRSEARFLSAREVKNAKEKPEKDGLIGGEFFTTYRLRKAGAEIFPEWWDGKKWVLLNPASPRRIHEEAVVRQFKESKQP